MVYWWLRSQLILLWVMTPYGTVYKKRNSKRFPNTHLKSKEYSYWAWGVSGHTYHVSLCDSLRFWFWKQSMYSVHCKCHHVTWHQIATACGAPGTTWNTSVPVWDDHVLWSAILLYTPSFLLLQKHNVLITQNKDYFYFSA